MRNVYTYLQSVVYKKSDLAYSCVRNFNHHISQMIGHVSGAHLNPAVTIGAVIMGLKSIPTGVVYILGQLIGATVGYGTLKVLINLFLWYTYGYVHRER